MYKEKKSPFEIFLKCIGLWLQFFPVDDDSYNAILNLNIYGKILKNNYYDLLNKH